MLVGGRRRGRRRAARHDLEFQAPGHAPGNDAGQERALRADARPSDGPGLVIVRGQPEFDFGRRAQFGRLGFDLIDRLFGRRRRASAP